MTIDPGTSSVVASSSCSVELLLAIFWAVFTRFSHFLVFASERGFLRLSKNFWFISKQGKPLAHFEKRSFFGSSKGDKPVWFSFAMLIWFSAARTVVWLSSLVSAILFFSNAFPRTFGCERFPQIF